MRRASRRGAVGLGTVLGMVAFLTLLSFLLLDQLERARVQVVREKARLSSEVLARSGLDFARSALRTHRWPASERDWTSPSIEGRGHFRIRVLRGPSGLVLRCTGVALGAPCPVECTREEPL